jgi:hypothetical protein
MDMHPLLVGTGVTVCALLCATAIDAQSSGSAVLESVTVTRPDVRTCDYTWTAVARNTGSAQIAQNQLKAQGNQGKKSKGGYAWMGAGGPTSFGAIDAGATGSTQAGFARKPEASKFWVVLYFAGGTSISEKTVDLPPEAAPSFALAHFTATETTFGVDVKNLLGEGMSGVLVQTFSAAERDAAVWKGAGAMTVDCLAGGGTYHMSGSKPSTDRWVMVKVLHSSATVVDQVFDTSKPTLDPTPKPKPKPKL